MTDALSANAASSAALAADEARAKVRAIVLELAPDPDEDPGLGADLVDDLGYNSLALLELAFTLEDEFDLQPIDEDTARQIRTVADVENHVVGELMHRTARPADL
jgi:acyl carrier protein